MSQSRKTGDNENKQPKLRQKCPYGFDCSGMMMLVGTIAHNCENLEECVRLTKADGIPWDAVEQPTFELVQYRLEREEERERRRIEWEAGREERERQQAQRQQEWDEERRRIREVIQVQQHQAAVMLLKRRGNPQAYADFGLEEDVTMLRECLTHLDPLLSALDSEGYIAPDGAKAHVYNVKRPPRNAFPASMPLAEVRREQRIFYYHKLLSKTAQFEGVLLDENDNPKKCKAIHLSHSDDARNIQGRLGIERRNQLSKIRTKLAQAQQLLLDAAAIAQAEYSYEDILALSEEAAHEDEPQQ